MSKEKSVLLKKENLVPDPKYSNEENQYIGRILARIMKAKTDRDSVQSEFNNMSYIEWFRNNENIANTKITRNETNKDLAVHSGTVEQKLQTVLAEISRLNLTGEIRVFDKESNNLQDFSTALNDIIRKTEEIEEDTEKKPIRALELLKQGTVFVQDNWVKRWQSTKKINKKFTGNVKDITWESKLEKVFDGPVRQILYGPGVYLGNIREFDIKLQPFIFTMKLTSYQEAKSRFGQKDKDGKDVWDRWKNVPKKRVTLVETNSVQSLDVGQGWSITDLQDDMVEELHYQDQINNEYQIFLNGIAMLPVGFPLSAITPGGMFNIEKQVLQVINPFFAYGRSFIAKTEQLSKLLDEMIKLLLIKTRKSIHPPYANISGKVISEKSLMPGAISMGIDPGSLIPIGTEGQGATASEYQMLRELREDIDRVTVSPQIQGQKGPSGTTALEVSIIQQQAQKTLTNIIFASGLLEKKLAWVRGNYILANYFEPIGTKVNETRDAFENIYRTLSSDVNIEGKGEGVRKVIPVDSDTVASRSITPERVFDEDEFTGTPISTNGSRRRTREELGMKPLQHLYLNIDTLKNNKYIFFTEVISKPRDNSNNAKLMFREELKDLQILAAMGSQLNMAEVEGEYAQIWQRRKEKMFNKVAQRSLEQEEELKTSNNVANILGERPSAELGAEALSAS
jgi:hypothetical protein